MVQKRAAGAPAALSMVAAGILAVQDLIQGEIECLDDDCVEDGRAEDKRDLHGDRCESCSHDEGAGNSEEGAGEKRRHEGSGKRGDIPAGDLEVELDEGSHGQRSDELGHEVEARNGGRELDDGCGDEAEDGSLLEVSLREQDGKGIGSDDELGLDADHRKRVADREVQDEACGQKDGQKDEGRDIGVGVCCCGDGACLGVRVCHDALLSC